MISKRIIDLGPLYQRISIIFFNEEDIAKIQKEADKICKENAIKAELEILYKQRDNIEKYNRLLLLLHGEDMITMKSGTEYTHHTNISPESSNPECIKEWNYKDMIITIYFSNGVIVEKKMLN